MQFQSILTILIIAAWQQESFLVSSQVHFKKGAPHVKLANGGLLSGIVKFSRDGRPYNAFRGITYATVPERFHEPQPIKEPTWEGVLSASKLGPMCSQMPILRKGNDATMGEEDCLNLNVYVPMNNTGSGKKGYPVMVWIHGGAFMFGGSFGYSPKFFMDEDVVVVTLNYRLGVYGFLSSGDGVIPGNNGLKDMVVALEWVQQNIKNFGGNPGSVTIFGESAGGAAVHFLLLSPTTKGLFHRAISQSGSALSMLVNDPNPKQTAVELATYLKCPTTEGTASGITSEEILACLKGMPTDELNKAQFAFRNSWPSDLRSFYFLPTIEPTDAVSSLTPFLSEHPISILTRRDNNLTEIPWMVGVTEDEGASMYAGVVISKPELLKEINSEWETVAPSTFDYGKYFGKDEQAQVSKKFKQFYFGDKEIGEETRKPLRDAYGDQMFTHGVYRSALETASRGKRHPVYLYQYAYKAPFSVFSTFFELEGVIETEMVGHGDELIHLFNFGSTPGQESIKQDSPDEEFSKNLVRLWVSFAIHGEPKHYWGNATFKKWKNITKREQVGLDALRWYRIESNPMSYDIHHSVIERMQFWDSIWMEHLTPVVMRNYKSTNVQQEAEKSGEAVGKTEL